MLATIKQHNLKMVVNYYFKLFTGIIIKEHNIQNEKQ